MPKIDSEIAAPREEIPDVLKPYAFHNVELHFRHNAKEATGECPFCGQSKFTVNTSTGEWRCFSCNEGQSTSEKVIKGGNATVFIRRLWEVSDKQTKEYNQLSESRGLLFPETLVDWNVCQSATRNEWLVPGWSISNGDKSARLTQLYRYVKTPTRTNLFPTPTLGSKMFGLNLFDPNKNTAYLFESVWDAMAVYEILGVCKRDGRDKLIPTSNVGKSLLADTNVIATPGCATFFDSWTGLFAGKNVVIFTQNDHPKTNPKTGQHIPPASYTYTQRTMRMLSEADNKPKSISMVLWGDKGYDEAFKSGYDARDMFIESGKDSTARIGALDFLLKKVVTFDRPTSGGGSKEEKGSKQSKNELDTLPCNNYKELVLAWRKAMKWTDGLDYALSIMLSAVVSTKLLGDQLWFMVISPPSSGKSTLCEALSANKKYVVAKSTIRGFHSGYKSDKDGEEDNSLIPQIMGKTLIVKDADSLLTAPNKDQILGEARDLYDGVSRNHYRHNMSRDYVGVRMTLILCGTSALREMDASELGARFLCCTIMNKIDEELEHEVGWRVVNRADLMLAFESDGQAETHQAPEMTYVMQMSSGYVSYLRENTVDLMSQIETNDQAKEFCVHLGKFISYMRARPSKKQDEVVEREFSARLISQLYRAAKCLAVVLNKDSVNDPEVIARIKRVAIDTAQGQTLEFTKLLYQAGDEGRDSTWISHNVDRGREKVLNMLRFLRHIGVVESFTVKSKNMSGTKVMWRLTGTVRQLFTEVYGRENLPK